MVTYNDRQEILCQRCTDIALNEEDNESNMPRAEKQVRKLCHITIILSAFIFLQNSFLMGICHSISFLQVSHQFILSLSFPTLVQLNPSTELSRSGSFSSQQEDIHKIFDFSKVPDVDPKTRTHLGSKYLYLNKIERSHT